MAKSIQELLRSRYPAKTHALMFEVRNGAGFSADRSCDAIAISTWPSRGLKLMGFEIKASRADWRKEIEHPEKADSFSVYCDEWYVVADGPKIVQHDEVPETWGYIQRLGDRLVCEKPAPLNTAVKPLPRTMLAAMLQRAIDSATVPGKREYDRGYAAAKLEWEKIAENRSTHARDELRDLQKAVQDFERVSGVRINSWNGDQIGEAVKLVMSGGHKQHLGNIRYMLGEARTLVAALERLNTEATATTVVPPTSNGGSASSFAVSVAES